MDFVSRIGGFTGDSDSSAFITTLRGSLTFWSCLVVTYFSYFLILDVTPPIFSQSTDLPAGVYYGSKAYDLPPELPIFVWILFLLAPLFYTVILRASSLYVYSLNGTDSRPLWARVLSPIIFVVILFVTTLSIIEFWPGFGNTRPPFTHPLRFYILFIPYIGILALLALVYNQRLKPAAYKELNSEANLKRFADIQWKYGRLMAALTVAVVVGITVPVFIQFNQSVAVIGMLLLWILFGIPLTFIAGFYLYRSYKLEPIWD